MANHVTNRVTISGPVESIADFRQACFSKHKPEVPGWWRQELAKATGEEAQK